MRSGGSVGGTVLERGELRADLGRKQIDPGGGDLADIYVQTPGFLQHTPKPHARRFGSSFGFASSPEKRAEAWLRIKPDELAVAPRYLYSSPDALSGRGAMTRPACSAPASDPGLANRSRATATPIVAGTAIATM
jgi:hypothetical protein